jgi:Lrp/AsnC family transcriptional regulator of ectoine degradation
MKKLSLDVIDIRILSAVQKHGQLSKTKLAQIVNLSATPCWFRLNKLKESGFILTYRADIALDRIGELSQVVVTVSLSHHSKADIERFEAHICKTDGITECISTCGGIDYILKIITVNLTEFHQLIESLLSADIGIDRYMIYIVTREIKSEPPNLIQLFKPNKK